MEINDKTVEKAFEEITGKQIYIDQQLIDNVFKAKNALKQYQYQGSPGPEYVNKVNKKLKKDVKYLNIWAKSQKNKFIKAEQDLYEEVKKFIDG